MDNKQNIERYRKGLQKLSLEMFELDTKLKQIESSDIPEANKKYAKEALEEKIKQRKVMSQKIEEALEKMYEEERQNYKEESQELSGIYQQESIDRRLEKYEAINTLLHNKPELLSETKDMSMEQIYRTYSDEIKQIILDSKYGNTDAQKSDENSVNEESANAVEVQLDPPSLDYNNGEESVDNEESAKESDSDEITPIEAAPVVDETQKSAEEPVVDMGPKPDEIVVPETETVVVSDDVENHTLVFDKYQFLNKMNMDEYTDDELAHVKNELGIPEGETLTEEQIKEYRAKLATEEYKPEKPKAVTAIVNKAKEFADKIKNNKGKVTLAALGGAALIIATGGTGLAFAPIGSVLTAAGAAPILASTVALDGTVQNHMENASTKKY